MSTSVSTPDTAGEGSIDCSVLMPVLNEERHIIATVAAMRRQRFDGRLEFILADGGSSDRTREIVAELAAQDSRIRPLDNPRRITPSGLNVALAHARGRWVARMDAHTEYPEDYLARGVQRLAQGDTHWVSGPQIARGTGPVSRAVALALRTPLGRGASKKWASGRESSSQEYDLDSGVFDGVWERETVLHYGGWDEEWSINQDSEMAGRFLRRGERLVCLPAMGARYVPRNTIPSLWRQYSRYGEYRVRTAVRHPNTMRRSHLLAPAVAGTVVGAIAAPAPVRRLARVGLGVYALALAGATASVARDAERPQEALLIPVVLAVMHLAHGTGAYRGVVRNGPPLAALAAALGLRRLAARLDPGPLPVYAPSLSDGARLSSPTLA